MDENGWFVTFVMYLWMFLSTFLITPIRWTVSLLKKRPQITFAFALAVSSVVFLVLAFTHPENSRPYGWFGIICALFSAALAIFYNNGEEPDHTIIELDPNDWFAEN